MPESIITPLLRDHAKIRTLAGELRAHTERFDLPGMRHACRSMMDIIDPHSLKEESGLFLIGMKFLKPDNKALADLIKEHHQLTGRLHRLNQLVFSPRLTNVEDQARQLVFVILEGLDHHFQEEEAVVFPALEKLVDDKAKELILNRYKSVDNNDFDDMDRIPLLSLPEKDSGLEGDYSY